MEHDTAATAPVVTESAHHTRIPVSVRQSTRRATAARATIVLATTLQVASLGVLVWFEVAFLNQPDVWRALFAALALVWFGVLAPYTWLSWLQWREARHTAGGGWLLVSDHALTLDIPAVFAEPLTIPADEVRAIALDGRGMAWPGLHWHRFPVVTRNVALGCLWRRNLPTPIPIAAAGRERPSMVVVFSAPRRFPMATGAGRVGDAALVAAQGSQLSDVRTADDLAGARPVDPSKKHAALFVAVDDVAAVRRALAGWLQLRRVLGPQDTRDVPGLVPMPDSSRTLMGVAVLAYVAIVVAAVAAELVGFADPPLLLLMAVPTAIAVNSYVVVRAHRALRRGDDRRPAAAKTRSVAAFLFAIAVAAFAVVEAFNLGSGPPTSPYPTKPLPYDTPAPPLQPLPLDQLPSLEAPTARAPTAPPAHPADALPDPHPQLTHGALGLRVRSADAGGLGPTDSGPPASAG